MNVVSLNNVSLDGNVIRKGASGGSSGGSSSESEWVYFDAINKKEDNDLTSDEAGIVVFCAYFATLGKGKTGDGVLIMPTFYLNAVKAEPLATAFDTSFFDVPISMTSGMPPMTMNELCEMGGYRPPLELLRATMLEITKEEFYSTDV